MRQNKTLYLLLITVAVLVMGIAYAAVTNIQFSVTGNATVAPSADNFKVVFGKVGTADAPTFEAGAGTTAGVNVEFTTPTDRAATLDVTGLKKVGDTVTAIFKVINESTDLDATLTDLNTTGTNTYFTVTAKAKDNVIPALEKTDIEVTVTLKKLPVASNAVANVSVNFSASPTEIGNTNGGAGGSGGQGGSGESTFIGTTIWEGEATTQDGIAVLGEGNLFQYADGEVQYRITVASNEFSGQVITVPIKAGGNSYMLFGLCDGRALGVTSPEDAMNKMEIFSEYDARAFAGYFEDGGSAIIVSDFPNGDLNTGTAYTITKIEIGEGGEITGDIEEILGGVTESDLSLMQRYVLGPQKTGRSLLEIGTIANVEDRIQITSFIDDPESIRDASSKITVVGNAYIEENSLVAIVRYNNKMYKIKMSLTTELTESVELLSSIGREGQTVKYDSNNDGTKEDWIILTDRDGLVEIVSAQPMGSLQLGSRDTSVSVTTDLDGDGTVGDDEDKAIESYNNAITTINNYCKSLVTATDNEGVRSVGASSDTSGNYSSENFNSWFKNSSKVSVKAGDEYYKTDYERMESLGIVFANEEYWVASRIVDENSSSVSFQVRFMNAGGGLNENSFWTVDSDGNVEDVLPLFAVRPVVINPSGI